MEIRKLIDEITNITGVAGRTKYDGLYQYAYRGEKDVKKVGFAVDPSLVAIKKSTDLDVDLLVTHHWIEEEEKKTVHCLLEKKREVLKEKKIFLAPFHLMLDFSPIGNFESMARELGFEFEEKIYEYETESGEKLKVLPFSCQEEPLNIEEFTRKLKSKGYDPTIHIFNNRPIKRIVIDTGSGGFEELLDGIYPHEPDLYITGEARHQCFRDARDLGINIAFLGHYNSEKIGLKNLKKELESKFPELDFIFIEGEDIDNPY